MYLVESKMMGNCQNVYKLLIADVSIEGALPRTATTERLSNKFFEPFDFWKAVADAIQYNINDHVAQILVEHGRILRRHFTNIKGNMT